MRLLILGGTLFLGRHVVDAALARGHDVTTFTRGKTVPPAPPPPGVEALHGDRDGDLGALEGRTWDAVIDTSGYVPRVVDLSAALLAGAVEHYVFVSSISAYADPSRVPITEDDPTAELPADHGEDVAAHYGALKAACERAVEARFPGRALHVRAGLIVGPHDPTGRYTWWVERVARGGEVLAPAPRDQPAQLIDARDLAAWMGDAAQRRVAGTMNATGRPFAFARLLDGAEHVTWVDEAFLLDQGVQPWQDLPLWVAPQTRPGLRGFQQADVTRAFAAGLTTRPLEETARDTLALGGPPRPKAGVEIPPPGLAPEREAALLAAWHAAR
ncbi:MAG: NAD-dependent epimerase/dehydratase family protein [Solirubrobacterales bacterium]|nr:NAD-dependent epimerase/dehydratase family protein [Solirubrobacterales bacterium]